MIINNQIIFDNTNREIAIIIFAICLIIMLGGIIYETHCNKNHS